MTETITGEVKIENPDQASTNFFWTWEDAGGQVFNLQTTVRGILSYEQIKDHIKTAMEAVAHVHELGGVAKQVGSNAYKESKSNAAPLPDVPSVDDLNAKLALAEAEHVPTSPTQQSNPAPQSKPDASNPLTFEAEILVCEIRDSKQYFKVKGGMFKKFGITVWDEVLTAAQINWRAMEAKEYRLAGYTATYVLNSSGKPQKVVSLHKADA